jgi:hypothetical protein
MESILRPWEFAGGRDGPALPLVTPRRTQLLSECLVRIGADVNVKGPTAEILFRSARMWGLEDSLVQWFLSFIPG